MKKLCHINSVNNLDWANLINKIAQCAKLVLC